MKIKSFLMFTAATMALFSSAMALDTTTYITIAGSTAGRTTVNDQLSSATGVLAVKFNGGQKVPYAFFKTSGTAAAANDKADSYIYVASTGVSPNKKTVIVRCWWQGSASGVNLVSNQVQLNNSLLSATTAVAVDGVQVYPAGYPNAVAPTTCDAAGANTVANFGFSDVKQAATPYQTHTLLESDPIYCLPFVWVKTGTANLASVSNISSQQARVLFTAGLQPLSLFTGVATDTTSIYPAGRDNDSGTRITALVEIGAGAFASLDQYKFTVAANIISAPVEQAPTAGYSSGGDLATLLGANGGGYDVIGYLGISDAATATGAHGVKLWYNGVPFSIENVKNGSYTFWSKYQQISLTTVPAAPANAYDDVKATLFQGLKTTLTGLATTGSGSSIKLTDLNVTRESDGADVIPN